MSRARKEEREAVNGGGSKQGATRLQRMDEIDREIVAALQAEGRRPYSRIAAGLEISESVVRYRAQRLQDENIIEVVGVADPLRIGFDRMALVGVRVAPGTAQRVCLELKEIPETSYVVMIAGSFDVLVELICRDTNHFTELLTGQVQAIEGVVATESFFVLEVHKMAYGWGVPDVALAVESRTKKSGARRDAATTTSKSAKKEKQ